MAHSTARLTAALDGRYRIEQELGAGGMATVYLAHDLKHDRKVAVKVLKPELAAVLGAERFVVEIKTTAALQHPHILPLFDSGEADGFLYYVMPYIKGETLRDTLNRESQLGVEEALRMTCDIADALHYAHEHGVIHRDIKPENILLQNGRPMVADFGIALAVSAAAGGRMTETGLSLGTPHYMSPEQATAEKEITARSDVYSLASVLYEMLTGNPPHTGATAQQIIMKIITEDAPDVATLRKSVPPPVADALAQALEKLPADRFASAAAFAAALNGSGSPTSALRRGGTRSVARAGTSAAGNGLWRGVAMGALLVAAAAIAFGVSRGTSAHDDAGLVEFAYRPIWPTDERSAIDISPDGQKIIQVVRDENGVDFLSLRALRSSTMTRIPGTEGARDPRFTPDGTWIVFEAQGQARKVPAAGGPSTLLADSISSTGVGVMEDGSAVVSSPGGGLAIYRPGQERVIVTTLDSARREFAHWNPEPLPGNRAIIFNSYASPLENSYIEVLDLESGERKVLVKGAIFPRYVPSGHLLFARSGAVFAVRFDLKSLSVTGPEVPILEDVAWSLTDGGAGFSVARNGTLVYIRASEATESRRVVWADRAGNMQPALPDLAGWAEPRLSPDGRWIAVTRNEPRREIWLHDIARRVTSQLTRNALGVSFAPVWMSDSRSLIFAREVPQYDLYRQPIDGSEPVAVIRDAKDKVPSSVSRDGALIAYTQVTGTQQVRLGQANDGSSRPIDQRSAAQNTAGFSPDGRWLAYSEYNTEGLPDVYIREVDGGSGRRPISANGGDQPLFTKNGREIVYRKGEAVYAVPFNPANGEVGVPSLLFRARDAGRLYGGRSVGYDVSADGSRFLLVTPIERLDATPNVVVLHWMDELSRLVPR